MTEETNLLLTNHLTLTGKLHVYLADLDKQTRERYRFIVCKMAENESMIEDLKRRAQWEWASAMNSIISRAEEIIRDEFIYT